MLCFFLQNLLPTISKFYNVFPINPARLLTTFQHFFTITLDYSNTVSQLHFCSGFPTGLPFSAPRSCQVLSTLRLKIWFFMESDQVICLPKRSKAFSYLRVKASLCSLTYMAASYLCNIFSYKILPQWFSTVLLTILPTHHTGPLPLLFLLTCDALP